ncbi:MAG: glycosyltransferase, partial [Bacteroidota bacterium]
LRRLPGQALAAALLITVDQDPPALPRKRMKTRVLVVLDTFNQGGAERQAVNLIRTLKDTYDFHVLALRSTEGPVSDQLMEMGVPFSSAGLSQFWGGYKVLVQNLWKTLWAIRKTKPTLILPFTHYPSLYACTTWKFTAARGCIWNQRDEGRSFSNGRVEKYALRQATRLISNSREGQEFILLMMGWSPDRVGLIHNGVTMPAAQTTRVQIEADHSGLQGKKWVAMVANLHHHKNQATLIKAWAQLPETLRQEWVALLVGKPMGTETTLQELAESLGVQDSVIQLGEMRDIAALDSEIELGVHFSQKEGVPNAVLEMMYQGKPVVASHIMGCEEALGEGYPYLVDENDLTSIVQHLTLLISQAEEREAIGKRNQARVQAEFSIENMASQFHNLLQGILR